MIIRLPGPGFLGPGIAVRYGLIYTLEHGCQYDFSALPVKGLAR